MLQMDITWASISAVESLYHEDETTRLPVPIYLGTVRSKSSQSTEHLLRRMTIMTDVESAKKALRGRTFIHQSR
jgi:hypothetical protein